MFISIFQKHIRHFGACLSLLLGLLILSGTIAPHARADNKAFFTSEIEVRTRQESERITALGQALLKVLVRLTGNPWIGETAQLKDIFADAEPYMRSYLYRSETRADGSERIMLTVVFEVKFLYDLMEVEQLLLWPVGRPSTLVWALTETIGENSEVISANSAPEINTEIDGYNEYYGMSVRLPLGDLQDSNAINHKDIIENNKAALRSASTRYLADSILLGHMYGSDAGGWYTSWEYFESSAAAERARRIREQKKPKSRFYGREELQDRQDTHNLSNAKILISCVSRSECVLHALDAVRAMLIKRDSVVPSELGKGVVSVRISNVKDYKTYQKVSRYLSSLGVAEYVFPKLFERNMVVYDFGTQHLPRYLFDVLRRERNLKLVTDVDEETDLKDIELTYRWTGK